MLDINLTEIEKDIKSGKIIPRWNAFYGRGFYQPCGKTIIRITQSDICRQYFGIETGRKDRGRGEEPLYGCFKGKELIWPAGAGCAGPWGTCPIYEKLENLIKMYDR